MVQAVTSEELKALMETDGTLTLLDVRRRADYEADPRTIKQATWRNPETVDAWGAEIQKDRPVVVYCVKGGSVSQSVADRLAPSHARVRFLQGGIKAWMEQGEPVE